MVFQDDGEEGFADVNDYPLQLMPMRSLEQILPDSNGKSMSFCNLK